MKYYLAQAVNIYPTNNTISITKNIEKISGTKMAMGLQNAPIHIRQEDREENNYVTKCYRNKWKDLKDGKTKSFWHCWFQLEMFDKF